MRRISFAKVIILTLLLSLPVRGEDLPKSSKRVTPETAAWLHHKSILHGISAGLCAQACLVADQIETNRNTYAANSNIQATDVYNFQEFDYKSCIQSLKATLFLEELAPASLIDFLATLKLSTNSTTSEVGIEIQKLSPMTLKQTRSRVCHEVTRQEILLIQLGQAAASQMQSLQNESQRTNEVKTTDNKEEAKKEPTCSHFDCYLNSSPKLAGVLENADFLDALKYYTARTPNQLAQANPAGRSPQEILRNIEILKPGQVIRAKAIAATLKADPGAAGKSDAWNVSLTTNAGSAANTGSIPSPKTVPIQNTPQTPVRTNPLLHQRQPSSSDKTLEDTTHIPRRLDY